MQIMSIREISNQSKRYDLQTKNTHAFYANGILVHNSIIKLWHDDDLWHISTNGMIDAFETDLQLPTEEFKSFGELFKVAAANTCGSYSDLLDKLDQDYTYIFELTSPWNRVVVPYSSTTITHLGSRNLITGQEENIDLGIKKPKEYSFGTFDEAVANAAALPFSQEGYVVVDKDWHRVKVKGTEYVACHRLRGESFTTKRAIDLALLNEQSEFLSYFPEYKPAVDRVIAGLNKIRDFISRKEKELTAQVFATQKEYALTVKDWPFSGYFFGVRNGRIKSINEYLKTLDYSIIEKWM